MRTEEEIRNDIKAVKHELQSKYGKNFWPGYNLHYIKSYDKDGKELLILDPEQEKLMNKLNDLHNEYWKSYGFRI